MANPKTKPKDDKKMSRSERTAMFAMAFAVAALAGTAGYIKIADMPRRALLTAASDGTVADVANAMKRVGPFADHVDIGNSAVNSAMFNEYPQVLRDLLDAGAGDHNMRLWAPLIMAAQGGYNDIIDMLIAADANVGARSDEALRIALATDRRDIALRLIDAGADVKSALRSHQRIHNYVVKPAECTPA